MKTLQIKRLLHLKRDSRRILKLYFLVTLLYILVHKFAKNKIALRNLHKLPITSENINLSIQDYQLDESNAPDIDIEDLGFHRVGGVGVDTDTYDDPYDDPLI